jgi:signal peptidase I
MKRRNKTNGPPGKGPPPLTPEAVIETRRRSLETHREFLALIGKIVCIIVAVWALFSFVFGVSIVKGEGMYPRMRDGDVTLWYRLESNLNIGDVVTFTMDGERQYGRVVAKGGDTVDFSEDGLLLLNGSAQQEEVFFQTSKQNRAQSFPMTVPEGKVFILGDNRTYSVDSRDYGAVSVSEINGKIISLMRRRGL